MCRPHYGLPTAPDNYVDTNNVLECSFGDPVSLVLLVIDMLWAISGEQWSESSISLEQDPPLEPPWEYFSELVLGKGARGHCKDVV